MIGTEVEKLRSESRILLKENSCYSVIVYDPYLTPNFVTGTQHPKVRAGEFSTTHPKVICVLLLHLQLSP